MERRPERIPVATYRLQFGRGLDFAGAVALLDHLEALGISDVYASPVFQARRGSSHGYDVVDHTAVSAELGGEVGLAALAEALSSRGMGLLLDLVPNHMCVGTPENRWWADVLENGPSSAHAVYFDVDWDPPKPDLAGKVLLPVLGDQFGRVLEQGELRVERHGGAFGLRYHEHQFPLAPKSWPAILAPARDVSRAVLGDSHAQMLELESILTALRHLPSRGEADPSRLEERRREKEIVKRRLATLVEAAPELERGIAASLEALNGRAGEPRSFDRLEALLVDQAFRLAHWRVAADEINYRRFFDVNELAALRVEEPEVFDALHALPFRLAREGRANGFRIDHIDGLLDPAAYLARLPAGVYVVAEKILTGDERLRGGWRTQGTTGYEFLASVEALFVDPAGWRGLKDAYGRLTGQRAAFDDVAYECRKLVLDVALSAELTVLARRLDRLSEQDRSSRDFTLVGLQAALAEVLACFPVYRSYVSAADVEVSPEDRRHILRAVGAARRRNPALSRSLFEFVASVLLLQDPDGLDQAARAARREFVLRFQQLTAPVMAKGVEDTACYRHYPLASRAEVGAAGQLPATPVEAFHRDNLERQARWPHALSATSTHDTKRDEDVRARIDVLSEAAADWEQALERWTSLNAAAKTAVDDEPAPGANEEYLLYQTLVGAWPLEPPDAAGHAGFVERIQEYMLKALREAKVHTSWVSPNEPYEAALRGFVAAVLNPAPSNAFLQDLRTFLRMVLRPGLLNAVSQTVLKVAAPGVPDFYQGTELPEFRLVDPDNRRPVDFEARRRLIARHDQDAARDAAGLADRLLETLDGSLKLFVTSRALRLRRRCAGLFRSGDYRPLEAAGPQRRHVVAFARVAGSEAVVVAAGRFFLSLPAPPVAEAAWGATTLPLDRSLGRVFRDAFTGRELSAIDDGGGPALPLAAAFRHLPVAVLERTA